MLWYACNNQQVFLKNMLHQMYQAKWFMKRLALTQTLLQLRCRKERKG